MSILIGIFSLLLVLICMAIFAFKFPEGRKALSGLSGAACATFLCEAFLRYAVGGVFGIPIFVELGEKLGTYGGLAVGTLVPILLGVSPVTAVIMGLSLSYFKLLPAFIAAYALSFLVRKLEKILPEGIDLLVIILLVPVTLYGLANFISPLIIGVLHVIGSAITSAMDFNPIIMASILGIVINLVGMTPLSSMVLTSLIGLTGVPMGIGAMACYGCSIVLLILFKGLKFSTSTSVAACIEPLTQTDIISMNTIPIFSTCAVAGAINGIIALMFSLQIPVSGMATPWAGLLVTLGNNSLYPTLFAVGLITLNSVIIGYLGTKVFKNYTIKDSEKIDNTITENISNVENIDETEKLDPVS